MDKPIDKVNCKACNKTHFALWSKDGETVECLSRKGIFVSIISGEIVENEFIEAVMELAEMHDKALSDEEIEEKHESEQESEEEKNEEIADDSEKDEKA